MGILLRDTVRTCETLVLFLLGLEVLKRIGWMEWTVAVPQIGLLFGLAPSMIVTDETTTGGRVRAIFLGILSTVAVLVALIMPKGVFDVRDELLLYAAAEILFVLAIGVFAPRIVRTQFEARPKRGTNGLDSWLRPVLIFVLARWLFLTAILVGPALVASLQRPGIGGLTLGDLLRLILGNALDGLTIGFFIIVALYVLQPGPAAPRLADPPTS